MQRTFRTFGILAILLLLTGCVANQPRYNWNAEQAASSSTESIRLLGGADKEVVDVVSRSQIKKIIEIKDRVETAAGPIRATLYLQDGKNPNAFATGQGGPKIIINLAMLKLLSHDDDMTAALIGHELAHIYAGHRTLQTERTVSGNILGIALSAAGVPFGGTLGSVTTTALLTPFERDQEREADRMGIGYAAAAGFDPNGGPRFFRRLNEESKGLSIPFLSTHPSNTERVENMAALATEYAKSGPPARVIDASAIVEPPVASPPAFEKASRNAGESCVTTKNCAGALWCKRGTCVSGQIKD